MKSILFELYDWNFSHLTEVTYVGSEYKITMLQISPSGNALFIIDIM